MTYEPLLGLRRYRSSTVRSRVEIERTPINSRVICKPSDTAPCELVPDPDRP